MINRVSDAVNSYAHWLQGWNHVCHHHHHNHLRNMELDHLLIRSVLTRPEVLLTLRLLMSYIYIYIYIYIYMERLFLMFLDHTQRRTTVGRTPLDE